MKKLLLYSVFFLFFWANVNAQNVVSFHGSSFKEDGNLFTGTKNITFELIDKEGNPIWAETQDVAIESGVYSVFLGSVNPLNSVIASNAKTLRITVEGIVLNPDLNISSSFHSILRREIVLIKQMEPVGSSSINNATAGMWYTKPLNTIQSMTNSDFLSLNANQVKLKPGRYFIKAKTIAGDVRTHILKLRDITNNEDAIIGSLAFTNSFAYTQVSLDGFIEIDVETSFELQHRVGVNGQFGGPADIDASWGLSSVPVTVIEIEKLD